MRCESLSCNLKSLVHTPATQVIIYGCLDQHLQERYLCDSCAYFYYQEIVLRSMCSCGLPYAATATGKLP